MALIEKSFAQWRLAPLEKAFSLKRLRDCDLLSNWLNTEIVLSEVELSELKKLSDFAFDRIPYWSEQDLILKLVNPVVRMANFDEETHGTFAEWSLSAEVNGYKLKGVVDLMIATGKYEPEIPYFCFHEYKKEKGKDSDPIGQMLAEMIAAQKLNDDGMPIYGSYVLGRMWFFSVLNGNEYCISKDYSATDDLSKILQILKSLKIIIDKRVLS